jgi:hypothetical protein
MSQSLPVPDKALYFVCRMCRHMAEQWDKGEKVCHLKCGGPRKGLTFPLYSGPMTRSYLRDHCFVCGNPAEMRMEVKGVPQDLGICLKHLAIFGVDEKTLNAPPDSFGVVKDSIIKKVDVREMLGIDPKDLGFKEPEKKEKP